MTDPDLPREHLAFSIRRQPDDRTCGPTCLHAVYRYFGDEVDLTELLRQVPSLEHGGTLGVLLANHALARGYKATVVTWNLQVFDPTWFQSESIDLRERLHRRSEVAPTPEGRRSPHDYIEFLALGGKLEFRDLESALLRRFLRRDLPILTGLSATFLYREPRERPTDDKPDDVAGEPAGHFVVLTGYDPATREVLVTDPLHPNPLSETHTYPVKIERVIGAIYLGVLTNDANLVILEPGGNRRSK